MCVYDSLFPFFSQHFPKPLAEEVTEEVQRRAQLEVVMQALEEVSAPARRGRERENRVRQHDTELIRIVSHCCCLLFNMNTAVLVRK